MLGWIWLVPVLLAARANVSRRLFALRATFSMLIGCSLAMWWTAFATVRGALLMFVFASIITVVPLLLFDALRRRLGWRVAVWAVPPLWCAWEWFYLQTEGSIGWLVLGINQSRLIWLIQYAELFGMWAISFWLVLFSVTMAVVIDRWQRAGTSSASRSSFAALMARLTVAAMVLLAVPALYSWRALQAEPRSTARLRVLAVQPNVEARAKWDSGRQAAVIEKTVAATDRAMSFAMKPGLIVWPEVAIPLPAERHPDVRTFLHRAVLDWNAPLLFGTIDYARNDFTSSRGGPGDEPSSAVFLLTPHHRLRRARFVAASRPYYKQRLIPFVERVPWVERFPWMVRFGVDLANRSAWRAGTEVVTFRWRDREAGSVTAGVQICFEALYPDGSAELVRRGAQLLIVPTNDAWYGHTPGARVIAGMAALRSIETRRAVVRCANDGVTEFVDRFGRRSGRLPLWQEHFVAREVVLSDEVTFFVRHPDLLPRCCLFVVAGFAIAALRMRRARDDKHADVPA